MSIAAEKPNRLAIRSTGGMMGSDIISDGEKMFTYISALKTYREQEAPAGYRELIRDPRMATGGGMGVFVLQLVAENPHDNVMEGVTSTEYVGKETLDGVDVYHLRFTQEQFDWEMWVRADGEPLLHQLSVDMSKGMGAMLGQGDQDRQMKITMVKRYEDWKLDEAVAPDTFAFKPPADAKPAGGFLEGLAQLAQKEKVQSPLVGQPAPPVDLELLDGGRLNLQDHANRDVVMLDFWASWCPPCRQEMPVVVEVSQQYRDRGVVFYAINMREDRGTIQKYLDETQLDVTVALDTTGSVGTAYGARSIPTLALIDRSGVVRAVHAGFSPGLRGELLKELDGLLAGGNVEEEPEQKPAGEDTTEWRTWTDATGGFTVEAKFIELKDGKAKLEKRDGTSIKVPSDKFCEADQKYIQELATRKAEP